MPRPATNKSTKKLLRQCSDNMKAALEAEMHADFKRQTGIDYKENLQAKKAEEKQAKMVANKKRNERRRRQKPTKKAEKEAALQELDNIIIEVASLPSTPRAKSRASPPPTPKGQNNLADFVGGVLRGAAPVVAIAATAAIVAFKLLRR